MEFKDLLGALAAKMGGEALEADDAGAVTLAVDEMAVTIIGLDEIGTVAFSATVAEPPPQDRLERLYRSALVANHHFTGTGGATLSIDPETNELSLCRTLSLAALDGESFCAALENFVNVLETWRKLVTDFRDTPDEAPDAPAASDPSGFDVSRFMQV